MAEDNPFTIVPSAFFGSSKVQSFEPAPDSAAAKPESAAATGGNAGGTVSTGVPGIGNVDEVFEAIMADSRQQTAISRQAAQQVGAVAADVRKSATDYARVASNVATEAESINESRGKAAKLATSNNILDRVQLIGRQTLDPLNYTREGRQGRTAELNQLLAIKGQTHNVKNVEAQARIAEIQAEAAVQSAGAESAYDRLKARLSALQVVSEAGAATEQMRGTQLSQQSLRGIQTTLSTQPDEFGYYKMGEFRYTETELLERKKNLSDRKLFAQLPTTAFNSSEILAYQQLVVDRMSTEELHGIIDNGMIYEGMQLRNDLVEGALEQRRIEGAEKLKLATVAAHDTNNTITNMMTRGVDTIEKMKVQHGPNTAIGQLTSQYQETLAFVQTLSEQEAAQTPEGKLMQANMLAAAEQEFRAGVENAIENQRKDEARTITDATTRAEFEAGGDKALIPILADRAMGLPTNPQKVADYVESRFREGRSFGRALPMGDARRLEELATEIFNKLAAKQGTSFDSSMSATERKELRSQAMGIAWEKLQVEKGTQAISYAIDASFDPAIAELGITPNPLITAGINRGVYGQLANQADQNAAEIIAANNDLTLDEWTAVSQERHNEVSISDARATQLRSEYNLQTTLSMYELLETKAPGVASRYTDWLTEHVNPVAKRVLMNNDPLGSVFAPGVDLATQDMINVWGQADEGAEHRMQQLATFQALKMGEPLTTLRASLTMIDDLTDAQKADVWKRLIEPTITSASQQGLKDEEVLNTVMSTLEAGVENDPALTNASRKVLRALPQVIRATQATHQSVMQRIFEGTWKGARAGVATLAGSADRVQRQDAAINTLGQPTVRSWRNQPTPWMPTE